MKAWEADFTPAPGPRGAGGHERFKRGDPTLGGLLRRAHSVVPLDLGSAACGRGCQTGGAHHEGLELDKTARQINGQLRGIAASKMGIKLYVMRLVY